jgi:hypothetical protein
MELWWWWIWCCVEHRAVSIGHRASGGARCWICRPFGAWVGALDGDSGLVSIAIQSHRAVPDVGYVAPLVLGMGLWMAIVGLYLSPSKVFCLF